VNSLWIWGGGTAPAVGSDPPPPLYSGDPLLHGYWLSQRGSVSGCPDAIDRCVDQSDIGFVATPAAGQMHAALAGLRRALADKRLDAITLLFADEWRADLTRRHRWRWWRRTLTLPSPERADG
ncbi:MAG: hypothetical protein R3288_09840, partial [Woeseiaceae bacterium]|nr:hypothetical protein [Woeseiaceae bacterium]